MLIVLVNLIHVIVAVFLILVVLLQTGKGAEMGSSFGGSSQTLFGGGGPASFMAKLTTVAAVAFMVTSLSLAYLSMRGAHTAGMPVAPAPMEAPVTAPETQAAPETQTETPAGEAGASAGTVK